MNPDGSNFRSITIVTKADLYPDFYPEGKRLTFTSNRECNDVIYTMNLYGSGLVRIPPEVGEMTALEDFDPYTSYRLHWFPFEITRCPKLKDSRVSTRALYGNFK